MNLLKRIGARLSPKPDNKYSAEERFWIEELSNYLRWYEGEIETHYGVQHPSEEAKVDAYNEQVSAILTWFEQHQKPKYLVDLRLDANSFEGKRVLDIGSGPMPSASGFNDIDLYCLDPLLVDYMKIGFPIHVYENVKFVQGYSENIPTKDNFFDVVLSVNAIDHVDDLEKTASEIRRVLKPNGALCMHVHYHKPKETEPIEINDEIMNDLFGWCEGFRKIDESKSKKGHQLVREEESYALWKNVD